MSASSSPLSSVPSSDDELSPPPESLRSSKADLSDSHGALDSSRESSPAQPDRPESPPHEYVLADNPDIAFIVMFRSRFAQVFPKTLPNFGPQDIESGVVDSVAGEQVENLLCALVSLVLNRKKFVERGHHLRALEECILSQKHQWPAAWKGANPLSGGRSFTTMTPSEKLILLKALILWALSSSEAIQAIIKDSYKQARHDDDLNQPLSVQPWGRDSAKRRYWLIEGLDDTYFRLYRESSTTAAENTWRSIAGSIEDLKVIAAKLSAEKGQAARRLSDRISAAIPRFESTEEKRKRREYRQSRKNQFRRPEPGFSLYEGRTRGKRMRYTFSDDEDDSDSTSNRRSTRQSGNSTPAEPAGPTFTASGRQVKPRQGGAYGETTSNDQSRRISPSSGVIQRKDDPEEILRNASGRPQRSGRSGLRQELDGWTKGGDHIEGYNSVDEIEEEEDAASSGNEWDGGEDDDDHAQDLLSDGDGQDDELSEEDEDMDDVDMDEDTRGSLVVQLRYNQTPEKTTDSTEEQQTEATKSEPKESSESKPPGGGDAKIKPEFISNGYHSATTSVKDWSDTKSLNGPAGAGAAPASIPPPLPPAHSSLDPKQSEEALLSTKVLPEPAASSGPP
ncbi:MAG: hypothetical protein M1819_007140 [Sarea resinae]|nr:MAG: hypothetical protein M1819_007140 [Sarea resinae]